jgi:hypothetical protein
VPGVIGSKLQAEDTLSLDVLDRWEFLIGSNDP